MTREGHPSAVGAALRLVARTLRTRGEAGAQLSGVPRRRLAVERRGIQVHPRRAAAYRAVTAGDAIAALCAGSEPLLPPAYPALWETALVLELLLQVGLRLPSGGLVHLESEQLVLRPLYLADRVRCRLELDRLDPEPRGTRMTLVARNWNASGQLCGQDTLVLLARERRPAPSPPAPRPEEPAAEEPADWREVTSWPLAANRGRRYARVSGDFNPIHLWAWSARLFGFDRPILHGFCTQALVAHALIEHLLGGEPAALRRLQISFRAPLLLPATARLLVAPAPGGGSGRFRVVGDVPGARPFAEGRFVG